MLSKSIKTESISGKSKTIKNTAMVSFSTLTVNFMKASFKMTLKTAKVMKNCLMVPNTRASLKMAPNVAKEFSNGAMGKFMRVNG